MEKRGNAPILPPLKGGWVKTSKPSNPAPELPTEAHPVEILCNHKYHPAISNTHRNRKKQHPCPPLLSSNSQMKSAHS